MRFIACITLAALASTAAAQPVLFSSGAGHTDHYYQRVDTSGQFSFTQARNAAAAMSYNGVSGQLATFDGPDPVAEQAWVIHNVVRTPSLPNPTLPSIYWFGGLRPTAGDTWRWLDGSAVPTALTSTWWVDVAEGAGAYGVVLANNYAADAGDYRQDDPSLLVRGFVVEFASGVAACGPADVGITGGLHGHDHALDNNDFVAFIDLFFAHDPAADLGSTGGVAGSDGQWDNNDFVVFIDDFFTPCV